MTDRPDFSPEVFDHLRSALVADVLDSHGHRSTCLGYDIVPMGSATRIVGRAYTVMAERVEQPPAVPYTGLLRALDGIGKHEIFVLPTQRAVDVAVWGELVSTACMARESTGMLTDGVVRDTAQIGALGFPVFARGSIPYDINGRLEITETGVPVVIDNVAIEPGALILGDEDGVVVVPRDIEEAVIAEALDKAQGESKFRDAVAAGEKPSVAYEKYGVL